MYLHFGVLSVLFFIFSYSSCSVILENVQFVSESAVTRNVENNLLSIHFDQPTTLVLHSKTQEKNINFEEIVSVNFFYRSNIHKNQDQFNLLLPNISKYPQPGIHCVIEYQSKLHKKKINEIQTISNFIEETLGFKLFSKINNFLFNEGASIKSNQWLSGTYELESNGYVEYYYKSLTIEEHQFIAQQRAIVRNQKNELNLSLSNIFTFETQPTQSLQSVVIDYSLQKLLIQENSIVSFNQKSIPILSQLDNPLTLNIINDCKNFECSVLETKIEKNGLFSPVEKSNLSSPHYKSKINVISFDRFIEGQGFHRELKTSLQVKIIDEQIINNSNECTISLVERISEDFFVDQYQVQEKLRFGGESEVFLDHTIDLEKPSYQSSPNVIIVKQNVKVLVSFPSTFIIIFINKLTILILGTRKICSERNLNCLFIIDTECQHINSYM